MRASFAAAMILAITTVSANAWAKKPSTTQAKKAAGAWLKALRPNSGDRDDKAATAVTATPFWSMSVHNESDILCAATTTPTPDKLEDTFDCVASNLDVDAAKAKLKTYKAKDLASTAADQAKALFAIKDATFLGYHTECTGSEGTTVIAVVLDGTTAKVAGVFMTSEDCGE